MKKTLQSKFSVLIQEFLEHRNIMGSSAVEYHSKLLNFDRFCLEYFPDESILTQEIAFAWCNDAKGNGGTNRARVIRGFARYMLLTGAEAFVMPPSFYPQQKSKLPFIMNNTEAQKFFEATDRYPGSGQNPLLQYTVPVIFRLMYAGGMRPQEVRRLRCVDLNFRDSTIYISEGKHNKDRCLPVNSDVMEMCRKYNGIAETINPKRAYFFQSLAGSVYTPQWLEGIFKICWEMSGNPVGRGSCNPYMFRHNFATQTLMRWVEEGRNLEAMIPYLSAYMGHEDFASTYYYIHLLPERLARMDFTRSDGVIPEVSAYEEEH